jgi:hypothetical protein
VCEKINSEIRDKPAHDGNGLLGQPHGEQHIVLKNGREQRILSVSIERGLRGVSGWVVVRVGLFVKISSIL